MYAYLSLSSSSEEDIQELQESKVVEEKEQKIAEQKAQGDKEKKTVESMAVIQKIDGGNEGEILEKNEILEQENLNSPVTV